MTSYRYGRRSNIALILLYQEILKPYQKEIQIILDNLLEQNLKLGGTRKVVYKGKLHQPYQMPTSDKISNCHESLENDFDELDKKITQLDCIRDTLISYITKMVGIYPRKHPLYFLPKAAWSLFPEPPNTCLDDEQIPDEIHKMIAHALLLRSIYEVN